MTLMTLMTLPLFRSAFVTLLLLGISMADPASAEPVTSAKQTNPLPEILDSTGFNKSFTRSNQTYLGGQPDTEGMQRLAEARVAAIVNLRMPEEMTELEDESGFNEAAVADRHGMTLYSIPMREEASFTPAAVTQFSKIYDTHDGNVFLHCSSGRRANYLWTAFLVRHKGLSIEEAQRRMMAHDADVTPLEGLLGESLPKQSVQQ
jgi:protein tyrosine phosphatase (PTP) superfamily phosphohydrolase (DUF442 family)